MTDHLHEFSAYRDATKKELEVIEDTLSKKAVANELEQLQALLQKQLIDQTQLVRDTCAPKEDTNRKLNQLSRKVRDLFEMVGKDKGTSDDGMLTKRHIGPNACASCDKTLVNMHGLQAEYSPHKKMPYREHADRIARYGAGFSKMLSTLQPSQSGANINLSTQQSPQNMARDNSQSAANLHFQNRQSPSNSSNPQLLTVFQKQDGSNNATSMRHQFQIWEEDSHGLIPTNAHPGRQRQLHGDQSTFQKPSGQGHLNSTMMQTMHTMPGGAGGGMPSGYGPGSTQEVAKPMPENGNNFKTAVGFFNKNHNSGSTPITGQPGSNAAAQALAQRQQIEMIEEQRKRHSSVVRGQVGQSTPYGVKVKHHPPGIQVPSGGHPDLSPMNMALRVKRTARSPDQQKTASKSMV